MTLFSKGSAASAVLDSALRLLYPDSLYCICCDKIIDSSRNYKLCNECMDGFKWAVGRTCLRCGKRLSQSDPRDICFSCSEHSHAYRRGYNCTEYGTHERALLYKLKYASCSYLADTIAEIMYDRMKSLSIEGDYNLLLPIPAHKSRTRMRGYNQAALIAENLSLRCGIVCRSTLLQRKNSTRALRSMTPEERKAALSGVFAIDSKAANAIAGQRILLVDDIYTTGATADAVAELLYDAGADYVDIMSFASGGDVVK